MFSSRSVLGIGCLLVSAFAVGADSIDQLPKAKTYSHWQGKWVISEKLNHVLGFTDEERGADAILPDPPVSISISLNLRIGEGMDANLLKNYRDLFSRIGHRVVATGKWEVAYRDGRREPKEPACFVTEHEGATFLFLPAPIVVLFGGKVSFLEGSTPAHDAIVVDFDTDPNHLSGKYRSPNTVGYQRETK